MSKGRRNRKSKSVHQNKYLNEHTSSSNSVSPNSDASNISVDGVSYETLMLARQTAAKEQRKKEHKSTKPSTTKQVQRNVFGTDTSVLRGNLHPIVIFERQLDITRKVMSGEVSLDYFLRNMGSVKTGVEDELKLIVTGQRTMPVDFWREGYSPNPTSKTYAFIHNMSAKLVRLELQGGIPLNMTLEDVCLNLDGDNFSKQLKTPAQIKRMVDDYSENKAPDGTSLWNLFEDVYGNRFKRIVSDFYRTGSLIRIVGDEKYVLLHLDEDGVGTFSFAKSSRTKLPFDGEFTFDLKAREIGVRPYINFLLSSSEEELVLRYLDRHRFSYGKKLRPQYGEFVQRKLTPLENQIILIEPRDVN